MVKTASFVCALLPLVSAVVETSWQVPESQLKEFNYLKDEYEILNLAEQKLRLVKVSDDKPARWILEEDKDALRRMGIRFMDITDHQDLGKINAASLAASSKDKKSRKEKKHKKHEKSFPHSLKHKDAAHKYISAIDKVNMQTNLALLTAFHSRYYKSASGAASGEFLFNLVKNVTSVHNQTIDVKQFKHPWGQHSVIARIQGSESNKTVVIGAHQDSASMFLPNILAAPGADDDGSGTVTILEVLRSLSAGQFKPKNTLEFHWYSAEEGGLLGSQAVFQAYEKEGREVIAMLQQDMTGYVAKTLEAGMPEALGVITDFVDEDLTKFVKTVIEGYCAIPWVETQCGYACSDHASASRAGYRSSFVIESEFKYSNPVIHSRNDVIEHLSFSHMLEHAKLTTGFAIELGLAGKHKKDHHKSRKGDNEKQNQKHKGL